MRHDELIERLMKMAQSPLARCTGGQTCLDAAEALQAAVCDKFLLGKCLSAAKKHVDAAHLTFDRIDDELMLARVERDRWIQEYNRLAKEHGEIFSPAEAE